MAKNTQQYDIYAGEQTSTVPPRHSHSELAGAVPAAAGDSFSGMGEDNVHASGKCSHHGKEKRFIHGHKVDFKGYTLEEIRLKKVINELKIAAAKDRLMLLVSPQVKGEVSTISGCIKGFDNILKYFDIAMLAYGITRRVAGFFRRFQRRR